MCVILMHWHDHIFCLDKARSVAGVTSMDNVLYCVGGFDGTSHLSDACMYDPRMAKWMKIASMANSR